MRDAITPVGLTSVKSDTMETIRRIIVSAKDMPWIVGWSGRTPA